jgi:hypothetical protein
MMVSGNPRLTPWVQAVLHGEDLSRMRDVKLIGQPLRWCVEVSKCPGVH